MQNKLLNARLHFKAITYSTISYVFKVKLWDMAYRNPTPDRAESMS
jgi:hypothetical protein